MIKTKNTQQGFTLIELAIVLSILGTIIGTGLQFHKAKLDQDRQDLTHRRMITIIETLDRFADYYGYLPCPANPQATFTTDAGTVGRSIHTLLDSSANPIAEPTDEDVDVGTCSSANLRRGTSPRDDIVIGAVPIHTLGLHPSYMKDGWNRRFTYAMDENLSFRGGTAANAVPTPKDGGDRGYTEGNADGIIDATDTSGNISVTNFGGTAHRSDDVAVIVISHGENGYGGYGARGGTQINAASGETTEVENSDSDEIFVQSPYEYSAAQPYDDIVYYRTKWQIDAEREF